MIQQTKLLKVDALRCIGCNQCIAVCPVKFANIAITKTVDVDENLCVGCGRCVSACSFNARIRLDDLQTFIQDAANGDKIIAFISPAIFANFPGEYLNLNGWLKTLGVRAFFDISFGTELASISLKEYINERKPKVVISQHCSTMVNHIQIYHPELIPYLAPMDSPTVHTLKMVKEFYPHYRDHKYLVITPCVAQKRELVDAGLGNYNVTFANLENFLSENNINLSNYPMVDYINEPAEVGAFYSYPGGMVKMIKNHIPEIYENNRVITGGDAFEYLQSLKTQIEHETAPFFIEILNCRKGCNGGTGTSNKNRNPDELEKLTNQHIETSRQKYTNAGNQQLANKVYDLMLEKFWEKGLYIRTYKNLAQNYNKKIKKADEKQITKTLNTMYKYIQSDLKNCTYCGYNSCETMAQAIFNGVNKKENCCYYTEKFLNETINNYQEIIKGRDFEIKQKDKQIIEHKDEIIELSQSLLSSIQKMKNILE